MTNLLIILDATHYPVDVYFEADSQDAYHKLKERNEGLTMNLCYLIRSRLHSQGWTIERTVPQGWREV